MSVLVFKLNDVSDEEADDVRQLLDDNTIEFYETSAGRWGVSVAGIWLKDKSTLVEARSLIDVYQAERKDTFQHHLNDSAWLRFKSAPTATIVFLLTITLVAYLSISPFLSLGE